MTQASGGAEGVGAVVADLAEKHADELEGACVIASTFLVTETAGRLRWGWEGA